MKIQELDLKNFGKFTEKQILFSDGMNLIYGKNEAGKSTIYTFIKSMLFGMERGRGRAAYHDTFSQYEPWEQPNHYAGVLKLESGGKTFLLRRNFDRYSRKAELICQDDGEELSIANGDLEMLLDGMTEQLFCNTLSIGQWKAEPNQMLAAALENYATNFSQAGDDQLDVAAAAEYLRKRKREIEKETEGYRKEKQEKRNRLEQEASYVWRDVHKLREELRILEENINLQEVREKMPEESIKEEKRAWPVGAVLFFLLAAAAYVLLGKPWNLGLAGFFLLFGGGLLCKRIQERKRQLQAESARKREETGEAQESLERLQWEKCRIAEELRDKETQYSNLQEQLEELEAFHDCFREQERKQQAVGLAQQTLQELSGQMQQEIRESLNEKVSQILREVTGGAYTKIFVEDDLKMSVWMKERKIPVEKLSRGTLEQIYFSLRMAAADMLLEEEQPILLDDTFAYYDEERLAQTLHWLAGQKRQILLFTCQKREEQILEAEQIPYQKVLL